MTEVATENVVPVDGQQSSKRPRHGLRSGCEAGLGERYGVRDAAGILVPLRLSQNDLGRLAGLSRETVIGHLQEWRTQKLIEADRRSIRIIDPGALAQVH